MTFRPHTYIDGTPISSAFQGEEDQGYLRMNYPVLGVVLNVHLADDPLNRSAWQRSGRRGFRHEARVLVLNDGGRGYTILPNVMIPPLAFSGIDNYSEYLPRPCSQELGGQILDVGFHGIDPYNLDGDWCIVQFLGGSIDQPFISSWAPHPQNTRDPATSGQDIPVRSQTQTTLDQSGRMFVRINGLELTVTRQGNLYLDTSLANSSIVVPVETDKGRLRRDVLEDGGSVSLYMKTGSMFELDFNPVVDGVGLLGIFDNDLPQTNPRASDQPSQREDTKTKIHADEDAFVVSVPDSVEIESDDSVLVKGASVVLEASTSATIKSNDISLGDNAAEALIKGDTFMTNLQILLTAMKSFTTSVKTSVSATIPTATALELSIDSFIAQIDTMKSSVSKTL